MPSLPKQLVPAIIPGISFVTVFSYLVPSELVLCLRANKVWGYYAADGALWRKCYEQRWDGLRLKGQGDRSDLFLENRDWHKLFLVCAE